MDRVCSSTDFGNCAQGGTLLRGAVYAGICVRYDSIQGAAGHQPRRLILARVFIGVIPILLCRH